MAVGITSLLGMGTGALSASQSAIETTGNNISNVNTPGYTRRSVRFEERRSIDSTPGQIGMGVEAMEVLRHFDRFLESAYLGKQTLKERFETEFNTMRSIDSIFNQTSDSGAGVALSQFLKAWSDLAQDPSSPSSRVALLEKARIFCSTVAGMDSSLASTKEKLDLSIAQEVSKANGLIDEIANLNREINAHTVQGRINPNDLLDKRDAKVRELSAIMDIKVEDKGAGHYNITGNGGMVLVQEDIGFNLSFEPPRSVNLLTRESKYNGDIGFTGEDGSEYTIEVIKKGTVDNTGRPDPNDTAQYRASLDGGRTWIKDTDGKDKVFFATSENYSNKVKDLNIFFTGSTPLEVGDSFTISPKSDVYWNSPTSGQVNVTSQIFPSGVENNLRITGGKLAGLFNLRDNKIESYRESLSTFTNSLTWEVNRIHTQGVGLTPMSDVTGTYKVAHSNIPLSEPTSGLHFADRLQPGNLTFAVYDKDNNPLIPYPGIKVFSPENFDPSKHSLEDIAKAINSGDAGQYMKATIIDDRLNIQTIGDNFFAVTSDTAGLASALGINTFFSGSEPESIAVRDELGENTSFINTGRVNGAGENNPGDNQIAREIAQLSNKIINIKNKNNSITKQTLSDFFGSSVTKVGADTEAVKFSMQSETAMEKELFARKEEISGVNIDEELSNLIRFQSSYKAAAKMITTADQMLDVIIGLKH